MSTFTMNIPQFNIAIELPARESNDALFYIQTPENVTTTEIVMAKIKINHLFVDVWHFYMQQLNIVSKAFFPYAQDESPLKRAVVRIDTYGPSCIYDQQQLIYDVCLAIQDAVQITNPSATLEEQELQDEGYEEGFEVFYEKPLEDFEENPEWLNDMIRGEDTD